MGYKFDCRLFSGYKPCQHKRSCDDCPHYDPVGKRIVIVSLEAMGAVLRSTCLLPAIKRRYQDSHITWITLKNTKPLLQNNPYIDKLMLVDPVRMPLIQSMKFDILYAVDKSAEAGAFAELIQAKEKFGFGVDENGIIRPLTPEADYQYAVGLDDNLKFFVNQKAETQQLTETMGLEWKRDPYILELTDQEKNEVSEWREKLLRESGAEKIIGYNTGCSLLFPYKKFTIEKAVELIKAWRQEFPEYAVALLGGPEDTQRQEEMKSHFLDDKKVINTPTTQGLRQGVKWMDTTDMVLSGCSLGLHIGIGLKKPAIAWFGVSCSQEIDLYDRGERIVADVSCTPCWKKSCDNTPKCYDRVELQKILSATHHIDKEFIRS